MLLSELNSMEGWLKREQYFVRKKLMTGKPELHSFDGDRCFCPEARPERDRRGKSRGWCATCGGITRVE